MVNIDFANMDYIQSQRTIRIETPLGADVLLPERMEMREAVNDLFTLDIAVKSKKTDIKPEDIVGKLVDVSLETGDGTRRTWNGFVARLVEGPPVTRGMRAYQLTIVPHHWKMTQNADNRIWLDKTAVEVARILCSEHGLLAPKTSGVVTEVKPQHYSVQMETDYAYMVRRLEEAGVFFWFEHEGGSPGSVSAKHRLVLANHQVGYSKSENNDVRFAMGSTDRNHISSLTKTYSFIPGSRSAADWNFLHPSSVPRGETPSIVSLPGNSDLNLREYPAIGGYGVGSASESIANDYVEAQSKLRMQAAEAEHNRVDGASNVRTLAAGYRFKPYEVAAGGTEFEEHAILEITHIARDRTYETNEGEPEYRNHFVALPSRVPATPHRKTMRPRIDGTQIAIIAGPEGEEIHTDKHARVKVWFPWDRRAKKDGSDTCWIRVGQSWAGGEWGAQVIPRIGMEAIVLFIDGDPDRPIITGLVPNPRQKVPYDLPKHKTKMVLRSDSHKAEGYNEISFEDEAGTENMFFHAQKDQTVKVLNNRAKRVENNQVESIGNNKNIEVARNHQEKIGGSMNVTVGGGDGAALLGVLGAIVAAGGNDSVQGARRIGNNSVADFAQSVAAVGSLAEQMALQGNKGFVDAGKFKQEAGLEQQGAAAAVGDLLTALMPIAGIVNTVIEKFQSTTIGAAETKQIGFYQNLTVGDTRTEQIGKTDVTRVGKIKKIVVGEEFVIEVGHSKFVMDKEGNVTILGTKFNFKSTGPVQINGKVIDLN